ncbi:MAG: DUF4411 family protein [Rhizobiaceae bacterium]|nr:DUF4411 family protein [Rhizobiaceae bacterium]
MTDYCLDTSGISNPWEVLPGDIYEGLWNRVQSLIEDSVFCCTPEIYAEMLSIMGSLGACIRNHGNCLIREIGNGNWPWEAYLEHVERMRVVHESVISEYNGNRKGTVGLNDISIIALAKTLNLPVVSMEKANIYQPSTNKRRIPDVCALEKVKHMDFNDLLRAKGIKI